MKILIILLTSCATCAQSLDVAQAVFYYKPDSVTLSPSQVARIAQTTPAQVTVYSDSTHMEARVKTAKAATGLEPKRIYSDERKISVIWLNK